MNETITLEVPERITRSARSIATRTHRRLEDVLLAWMDHAVEELAIEDLPDEQVLRLCDQQLDTRQQTELSNLLDEQREGKLGQPAQVRLDRLMQLYRHGLVRKAQAWQVAVARGLRGPLNSVEYICTRISQTNSVHPCAIQKHRT